jgi:hypothetical protein
MQALLSRLFDNTLCKFMLHIDQTWTRFIYINHNTKLESNI